MRIIMDIVHHRARVDITRSNAMRGKLQDSYTSLYKFMRKVRIFPANVTYQKILWITSENKI